MTSSEKCPKCGDLLTGIKYYDRGLIVYGYIAQWKECSNPHCDYIKKYNRIGRK